MAKECSKCFYLDEDENYCDLFDMVVEPDEVLDCAEFTADEDIVLDD